MIDAALDALRIARYRFDLEAVDRLFLPPYKGSTFRGGFGYAFKKMVCGQQDWLNCTPCTRGNACPYGYLFETRMEDHTDLFPDLREVPIPFIIEPPLDTQTSYRPGERLAFHVVLVGRGIQYLPYFLLAFQELGRVGVGKPRGRYI